MHEPSRITALALLAWLALLAGRMPAQETGPDAAPEVQVQASQDAAIARRLNGVFANVEELNEVSAEVTSGVVRLTGESPSAEWRQRAAALAKDLEGVILVDNDIQASVDVAKRLLPGIGSLLDHARVIIEGVPLFLIAIVVFVAFWFLAKLVDGIDGFYRRTIRNSLIRGIVRQFVRSVVVLFGLYLALEIVGATALVGGILGTAGVVGLAVGFAFRDIVENYLAGIILSIRQPFTTKDSVEIEGHQGTVVRLTASDTVLMTADGNHLRLSNAMVFKSSILNYTRNPRRRFDFAVGVGVDEDLEAAQRIGLEELNSVPGVLSDPPPSCRIEELGDSNVLLRFFGWVDQHEADFFKVKSQSIRLVKIVLDDHGVDMPAPIYKVEIQRQAVHDKTEPAPPPRRDERPAIDVSVDRHLEDQVEEDIRASAEEDLLDRSVKPNDTRAA